MFVLVQMRDTISIHPSQFARDQRDVRTRAHGVSVQSVPNALLRAALRTQVLTEEIDAKYANKVGNHRLFAASRCHVSH